MASLQKNVASQNITFGLIVSATGVQSTSTSTSILTAFITKDGTQAAAGGTFTNLGSGQWNYAPTQAETNATNVSLYITATSCAPVNYNFYTDFADFIFGTASGGSTTTCTVSSLNNPSSLGAAGQLIGRTIIFRSDTSTASLQGQASNIIASTTGVTPTITYTTMTTAPANGDTFVIV